MTEQLLPRPRRTVRSRLLSVTGMAVLVTVVGSVLIWHSQLGELFSSEADKEPVISGVSGPPATLQASKPTQAPTKPTAEQQRLLASATASWLDKNGWRYGLCRPYENEPWHFEALTAPGTQCPPRALRAAANK
jgi:hypothetical protein